MPAGAAPGERDEFDGEGGATFSFVQPLWEWTARASWFFVSLPEDVADEIEERFGRRAAGFGSVPVEATVGSTTWTTSIFPSDREKTYVLPVKKAVRVAEGLSVDDMVDVDLAVRLD